MSRIDDRDLVLARAFRDEAATLQPPGDLLEKTLRSIAGRRSKPTLVARVAQSEPGTRRVAALGVALVAVLLMLVALGLAGGGRELLERPSATRPPGAVHHSARFIRAFTWVDPADAPLTVVRAPGWFVGFTHGSTTVYPELPEDGTWPADEWGITVSAPGLSAATHPCPMTNGGVSRVHIDVTDSRTFAEALRTVAGLDLRDQTMTTFDGRPAMTALVVPRTSRCEGGDVHVAGSNITGGWIELHLPSRLVLTEVDDELMVIQVWAGSEATLEAVRPQADEFLRNFHFTGEPYP